MTLPPQATSHEVRIVDGRFASAACSCGWRSAGRRSRATVRAEARDHALLYAGTADESLVIELVVADPLIDAEV